MQLIQMIRHIQIKSTYTLVDKIVIQVIGTKKLEKLTGVHHTFIYIHDFNNYRIWLLQILFALYFRNEKVCQQSS